MASLHMASLHMARSRYIFVLALALLWTALPALACLSTSAMTQAEVSCCKKMAGDCQMGLQHHSCCKPSVSRTAPIATVEKTQQIQPRDAVLLLCSPSLFVSTHDRKSARAKLGLPPPAPPGPDSILRI